MKNFKGAKKIYINGTDLTIEKIHQISNAKPGKIFLTLAPSALKKMQKSRDFVQEIVDKDEPVYGINTGFGALANQKIKKSDSSKLQINLIRSHCTALGDAFDRTTTRAIMLLRANCLSSGYSGINPKIVELILDFINHDIVPIVPKKGSVGASGDLAPLSHIALSLIGEGKVKYQGKTVNSKNAILKIGKKPIILGPKDGLALINGTAVMTALGSLAIFKSHRLLKVADIVSCMTLDGIQGTKKAFDRKIHLLKPHKGQLECSKNLIKILKDSKIDKIHKKCFRVQDPYSLRCIPQVHGASRQTFSHARDVIIVEINSVTDNPLIFTKSNQVISGGNFHGEAIAFAMDYLAMGISEISSISERRVEKLVNPAFSGLPAFLTKGSGLNSGLMIAHVTAAALASENKILCHPASVDSIPTSTDKEDHVSMGPIAGRKLHEIIKNTTYCLAIELLCASQAIEFQRPFQSSKAIEAVHTLVRKYVRPIHRDRIFYKDIEKIINLIESNIILETVENIVGELK